MFAEGQAHQALGRGEEKSEATPYRMQLYGVFRLETATGITVEITSKKARALLAILGTSPRGERSRTFLQDTLWSRCERAEAQSSLRRELSSLRQALGRAAFELLSIDRDVVALNLALCRVDARESLGPVHGRGAFLEGMDLRGEEAFEVWLRNQRTGLPAVPSAPAEPSWIAEVPGNAAAWIWPAVAVRLEAWHHDVPSAQFHSHMLREQIISGLRETGSLKVLAAASFPVISAPDIDVVIDTIEADRRLRVVITGQRSTSGDVLMSMQAVIDLDAAGSAIAETTGRIAAECVDRVVHAAAYHLRPDALDHVVGKKVITAIAQMFSLNGAQVRESSRTLLEVSNLSNQGVFHAWRAYQAVFDYDHAHAYDTKITLDESRENMRIALELDPYNSLSLSLCAFVHAFLFKDFITAFDLIERAAAVNANHVMYFDALSMLNFYTGRLDEARVAATRAADLGRHLSFRYCFATAQCMIEALSGRFEAAVVHGRRALALEPVSRTVSYPPTMRYLGASLSAIRQNDEASAIFTQLRSADPGFHSAQFGKPFGTAPSAAIADFFRKGLLLVGL